MFLQENLIKLSTNPSAEIRKTAKLIMENPAFQQYISLCSAEGSIPAGSKLVLSDQVIELPCQIEFVQLGNEVQAVLIDKAIGGGKNGEVFKGYNLCSEVYTCVVKHVQANQRGEFINETSALHSMLRLLGTRESEQDLVMAMRLEEGQDLNAFLRSQSQILLKLKDRKIALSEGAKKFKIMLNIGQAIADFHSLGYIHRDIKELNIMINEFLNTVLIDFGGADKQPVPQKWTVGSTGYFAPELTEVMLQGKDRLPFSQASDVYAVGVIFKNIMIAFSQGSAMQVVNDRIYKDANSQVQALIDAIMSENPESRPSADEVRDRLHSIVEQDKMIRKYRDQSSETHTENLSLVPTENCHYGFYQASIVNRYLRMVKGEPTQEDISIVTKRLSYFSFK